MYSLQKLADGLRLIAVPMKETKALTALVLFGVGSRYEKKAENGMAHFIEHMLFKGTLRRPTTLDLSRELDAVGAEYNAYTSRDHTGYYIRIDASKAELALDMLSDMIWRSKFDAEEIEREKKVIAEELNMYQDNPAIYIEQFLEEAIFPNHPLGRDIGGSGETIKKFTRRRMMDFYSAFYCPANLVLVLAGPVDGRLKKMAWRYFKTGGGRVKKPSFLPFAGGFSPAKTKIKFKKTDQTYLAIGFPSYSYDDKRSTSAALLNLILGATMSSRLFIEVRERRGLCYMIRSGLNHYQETGNLVIEAGLDSRRLKEAGGVIRDELEKIKKTGVAAEELRRAKDNLKGRLILSGENSHFQAEWHGRQALLMKKIETISQKIKRIEAVGVSEVAKAAKDIFDFKKMKKAIIGPYHKIGDLGL